MKLLKQNHPPIESVSPASSRRRPFSESKSLCTRDDVTVVDVYKHSTLPLSTQGIKNFQTNTIQEFESVNRLIPSLCMSSKLSEVCISIYKVKCDNQIGGDPCGDRDAQYLHTTHGLCSYNA